MYVVKSLASVPFPVKVSCIPTAFKDGVNPGGRIMPTPSASGKVVAIEPVRPVLNSTTSLQKLVLVSEGTPGLLSKSTTSPGTTKIPPPVAPISDTTPGSLGSTNNGSCEVLDVAVGGVAEHG